MSDVSSTRRSRNTSKPEPKVEFHDVPTSVAAAPERTKRAEEYERKITDVLSQIMRMCAANESTVADAATLIQHGPALASKAGDLADQDARVRKAVDMITSGTENPYIALGLATLPLVAQIMRNHETGDVSKRIHLRIPFTKRSFKLPFKLRLSNPFVRSLTVPPDHITNATFGNPDIRNALAQQGIDLAWAGAPAGNGGTQQ